MYRRLDPVFYSATLFAPGNTRVFLQALNALHLELRRPAPVRTKQLRLQIARDSLLLYKYNRVPNDPHLELLTYAIKLKLISFESMISAIDAHEDENFLSVYLAHLDLLNIRSPESDEAAIHYTKAMESKNEKDIFRGNECKAPKTALIPFLPLVCRNSRYFRLKMMIQYHKGYL